MLKRRASGNSFHRSTSSVCAAVRVAEVALPTDMAGWGLEKEYRVNDRNGPYDP